SPLSADHRTIVRWSAFQPAQVVQFSPGDDSASRPTGLRDSGWPADEGLVTLSARSLSSLPAPPSYCTRARSLLVGLLACAAAALLFAPAPASARVAEVGEAKVGLQARNSSTLLDALLGETEGGEI